MYINCSLFLPALLFIIYLKMHWQGEEFQSCWWLYLTIRLLLILLSTRDMTFAILHQPSGIPDRITCKPPCVLHLMYVIVLIPCITSTKNYPWLYCIYYYSLADFHGLVTPPPPPSPSHSAWNNLMAFLVN